jgi:hypothetical protein
MSFTKDTLRSSAQRAIYDVVRAGLLYVFLTWARPWLTEQAETLNIPGAVAWATLLLVVLAFAGVFVFDWWRAGRRQNPDRVTGHPSPQETSGKPQQESDLELAAYLSEQCNEAITQIRDKMGHNVRSLPQLSAFCKTAGRWFGRNEYVVERVRGRFPVEVDQFVVYGDKFNVQIGNDQIENQANHLRELITVKVERLRTLSKALSDDARNRNYGQVSINIGR